MLENTKNIMLQTEDLTIGYAQKKGDKIVLSKINIAIESGKLISVLGKNGIGKIYSS